MALLGVERPHFGADRDVALCDPEQREVRLPYRRGRADEWNLGECLDDGSRAVGPAEFDLEPLPARLGLVEERRHDETPTANVVRILDRQQMAPHVGERSSAVGEQRLTEPTINDTKSCDSASLTATASAKSHRPYRHAPEIAHLHDGSETHADDERCPNCAWSGDVVTVQCARCRAACDEIIEFLTTHRETSP